MEHLITLDTHLNHKKAFSTDPDSLGGRLSEEKLLGGELVAAKCSARERFCNFFTASFSHSLPVLIQVRL